jgi:hypothetical protein
MMRSGAAPNVSAAGHEDPPHPDGRDGGLSLAAFDTFQRTRIMRCRCDAPPASARIQ